MFDGNRDNSGFGIDLRARNPPNGLNLLCQRYDRLYGALLYENGDDLEKTQSIGDLGNENVLPLKKLVYC